MTLVLGAPIAFGVLSLLLALAGITLLAAAIRNRVRATRLPRSLVVEYAPRRESTVLADAILAGRERRAATAALLDLAVRRRIRLVVDETGGRRTTVGVELIDGVDLTTRELALLDAISDPAREGRVRRFSRSRRRTGIRVRALIDGVAKGLVRRSLLAPGGSVRAALRRLAGLVALISALTALLLVISAPLVALPATIGLCCAVAAVAVLPPGQGRRFTAGAEPLRRHLDGLRQYLRVAEAERLRFLQGPTTAELEALPDDVRAEAETAAGRFRLHEKLLPYAVLFGVEREWIGHLRIAFDGYDGDTLVALGDAAEVAADLLVLAHALGSLGELVAAIDGVSDAAGGAVDVTNALGALHDLLP